MRSAFISGCHTRRFRCKNETRESHFPVLVASALLFGLSLLLSHQVVPADGQVIVGNQGHEPRDAFGSRSNRGILSPNFGAAGSSQWPQRQQHPSEPAHGDNVDPRRGLQPRRNPEGPHIPVQDVGPDGRPRKKIRLGPIVFNQEAVHYDDNDDYMADDDEDSGHFYHGDGGLASLGRPGEDSSTLLLPHGEGGPIGRVFASLVNFGHFMSKLFGNLLRQLGKQVRLLACGLNLGPILDIGGLELEDLNPSPSHQRAPGDGRGSLVIIVVASWVIFGLIVALIAWVVGRNTQGEVTIVEVPGQAAAAAAADDAPGLLGKKSLITPGLPMVKTTPPSPTLGSESPSVKGESSSGNFPLGVVVANGRLRDDPVSKGMPASGSIGREVREVSMTSARSAPPSRAIPRAKRNAWLPIQGMVCPSESCLVRKRLAELEATAGNSSEELPEKHQYDKAEPEKQSSCDTLSLQMAEKVVMLAMSAPEVSEIPKKLAISWANALNRRVRDHLAALVGIGRKVRESCNIGGRHFVSPVTIKESVEI